MDWYNAVSALNIEFSHQGAPTQLHNACHDVVHLHVLEGVILAGNSIIDAVTRWAGQVQDKAPFTWLIVFGDGTKATDMKTLERGPKKGACHPAQLYFGMEVIIYDLGVRDS